MLGDFEFGVNASVYESCECVTLDVLCNTNNNTTILEITTEFVTGLSAVSITKFLIFIWFEYWQKEKNLLVFIRLQWFSFYLELIYFTYIVANMSV